MDQTEYPKFLKRLYCVESGGSVLLGCRFPHGRQDAAQLLSLPLGADVCPHLPRTEGHQPGPGAPPPPLVCSAASPRGSGKARSPAKVERSHYTTQDPCPHAWLQVKPQLKTDH